MNIQNETVRGHRFLRDMQADSYFPPALVARGIAILVALCETIEQQAPRSLEALYALTHAATEEFNRLGGEFEENGSELETAARENIGGDFEFIAKAYGFDADTEELIAPRDW